MRVNKMAGDEVRKVFEVFGFDSLDKQQEEALQSVFESQSDVFVNLPTGFGKSVVFQALPIVYSPLDPIREKNIVHTQSSALINLMKTKSAF